MVAEPGKRVLRSEQGNWLNCTPNSGPLSSPGVLGAGGKCCCTIMLAVRVEKALPLDDRYAPVIALAMAPAAEGNDGGNAVGVSFGKTIVGLAPVML